MMHKTHLPTKVGLLSRGEFNSVKLGDFGG